MVTRPHTITYRNIFYLGTLITFIAGIGVIILQVGIHKPDLNEIFPTGEIRIGVDATYPPFAFIEQDNLAGFEIALGEHIGEQIGLSVRFVNMGFDGLYDSLIGEPAQVDLVISRLIIDPMRSSDVYYTRPYFNAGLVLVTDDMSDITDMNDLQSETSLAYEFGSTADNEARRWLRRIPPFETRPYEIPQYALDAVRLKEADVALTDSITASLYLNDYPQWSAEVHQVTDELYAIAVRIHDVERWRLVENALTGLFESGVIEQLQDEWF